MGGNRFGALESPPDGGLWVLRVRRPWRRTRRHVGEPDVLSSNSCRRLEPEALKSGSAACPFCGRGLGPPELGEAIKAKPLRSEAKPPTLLRRAARVPLMLVICAPAGSPARTRKLEISW